jgi:hypothetical protein
MPLKKPKYNEFTKKFMNYIKDLNEIEDVLDFIIAFEGWDGKTKVITF